METHRYKYTLPRELIEKVANLGEFHLGGTQVHVKLVDGRVFPGVLISNCKWIIATRGYKDLPFSIEAIEEIFQSEDDENPAVRGGWDFFGKESVSS